MSKENTNIEDYSIPELMNLIEIDDLTIKNITEKTNTYIQKFKGEGDSVMASFFEAVKSKLLDSLNEQTVDEWYTKQYLESNEPVQNIKLTSRNNKVQEFDGALKREKIAINQSKPLPFAQGDINPTLRNKIQKILNIDSLFRVNNIPSLKGTPYTSEGIWSATNFTADLSEQLTRVLSLKVNAVQIPFTWYNISKGSNVFYYAGVPIVINAGNYTIHTVKAAIEVASQNNLKLNIDNYNITGKVIIESSSAVAKELEFYKTLNDTCKSFSYINNTLGWILGFREPCYSIKTGSPVNAEAVVDLNGPKYLLLYMDEFNMNRVNNGLVNIEDRETKLNLPDYYNTTIIKSKKDGPNFTSTRPLCIASQINYGNDCSTPFTTDVPFFTQNLPRTLTQAQQYSINEIIKNRKNSPNIKVPPPSTNNLMAIIPVNQNGMAFGDVFVEKANTIGLNIRNYFGPVDIERIEVKLYDDKGNILDLNGSEWSFSVLTTQLYQY